MGTTADPYHPLCHNRLKSAKLQPCTVIGGYIREEGKEGRRSIGLHRQLVGVAFFPTTGVCVRFLLQTAATVFISHYFSPAAAICIKRIALPRTKYLMFSVHGGTGTLPSYLQRQNLAGTPPNRPNRSIRRVLHCLQRLKSRGTPTCR